jgi:hypothetical protein
MRMFMSELCHRPCPLGRWPALWLAAALALGALSAAAAPVVAPIEDNDVVRVTATGKTGQIELTLARAPASSDNAMLKAANRDNYALWSGKLTRQGNRWTASIDRAAVQALLIMDKLIAEFPGAARDGEALHLVITRERYLPALEPALALLGDQPLFFNPPKPPERPEVPAPTVDRPRADSFAMIARLWDHQIVAHQHEFAAARSRSLALFLDLRTAGRLPWPPEALERLAQRYQQLSQQEQAIARTRQEWRATAQKFAEQWNAAHSSEPPLTVNFGDAS